VSLDGKEPDRFVEETYRIPDGVVRPLDQAVTVRFVAKPGSRAGGVYDVRLLRR
jgi:hypothetical protein